MRKWKDYQFASWNGVLVQILPELIDPKIEGETVYWVKLLSGYDITAKKRPILGDVTIARESDLRPATKDNLKVYKSYS